MSYLEKRREIQRLLGVTPDGVFGPRTRAAFESLADATDGANGADSTNGHQELLDPRSETTLAGLLAPVQVLARELVHRLAAQGITAKVISGLRTYDEQNELYAQGRTKAGRIVTNAKAGYSMHNFGLAFDIGIFEGANYRDESPHYRTAGRIGRELGLSWGGDFTTITDEPHFELHPVWSAGLNSTQLLAELRRRKGSGEKLV